MLASLLFVGCTNTGVSNNSKTSEENTSSEVNTSSGGTVSIPAPQGDIINGTDQRMQKDTDNKEVYNLELNITNPAVDSGLADPDIHRYGDMFWIYGTKNGADNVSAAFSTDNMKTWTRIEDIVDMSTFPWATKSIWAPCAMYYNGKYYIAFSNGDSYDSEPTAGINIGVADKPEGPYKSVTDRPVIYEYVNGACIIDQDFFVDDDGTVYMIFGGAGNCNACLLTDDLTDVKPFPDGDRFKKVEGLKEYVEGPQIAKRGDTYYMFYSKGVWSNDSYGGCYATSDSPIGPYEFGGQILMTSNNGNFKGPGHNSVIYIPENNMWLTCYHRYNYGTPDRRPCIDRLVFNDDGSIRGVVQTDAWSTNDDFGIDESNLALKATATDSGYKQYGAGKLSAINDGDAITYWQFSENSVIENKSEKTLKDCWITLALAEKTTIQTLVLSWENGTICTEDGFYFEVSNDGETWTKVTVEDMTYGETTTVTLAPVEAAFIKLTMTRGTNDKYCPKIYEWKVYGVNE